MGVGLGREGLLLEVFGGGGEDFGAVEGGHFFAEGGLGLCEELRCGGGGEEAEAAAIEVSKHCRNTTIHEVWCGEAGWLTLCCKGVMMRVRGGAAR